MKSDKIIENGTWHSEMDEKGVITGIRFDESFRKLLGYKTRKEFPDTLENWENSIHPDDLERVEACLAELKKKHPEGKNYDLEYRMKTASGYHWVHDFGQVTRREDGSFKSCDGVMFDIQKARNYEIQQKHDELKKEVVDFMMSHNEDPIELLKTFAGRIRELIGCDQVIYRDLEETRFMINSPAIEKTWSVPIDYCRQCQHFDAHHPMYAGGFTLMDNCQEGWKGVPVYKKCPIKSSLTRIVYCNGEVAGYMAIHFVQEYHHFTEIECKTFEAFVNSLSLILSRYTLGKETEKRRIKEEKKRNEIIESAINHYQASFYWNLEDGTYSTLGNKDKLENQILDIELFGNALRKYIDKYVHPDDANLFEDDILDHERLKKTLSVGNRISFEYRSMTSGHNEWRRILFSRVTKDSVLVGINECQQEVQERLVNEKLLNEYDAIYLIDLDKNEISPARQSRVTKLGVLPGKTRYDVAAQNFAQSVAPQYQEQWNKFCDTTYLKQYMANEDHREFVYELPETWQKMRRLAIDVLERENGMASVLLFSFVGIDNISAKALEMQQQIAEQGAFTRYFLEPFQSAYYVGLDDLSLQIYKRTDELEENYPVSTNYVESLEQYIEKEVHPDDRRKLAELIMPAKMKEILATKPEFSYSYRLVTKHGERYMHFQVIRGADESHAAFGFRDITAEVKTQQKQQKQLKDALDRVNEEVRRTDLICEINNSGKWSYDINRKDEVVGAHYSDKTMSIVNKFQYQGDPMNWVSYLHPIDKDRVVENFYAAIRDHSGNTEYNVTFRIMNSNGKYRWNKSAGKLLRHEDGTAELIGMNTDITSQIEEQEKQQKLLAEALDEAQAASRAKTAFLNNMSHDIRTPMNAIIGFNMLALRDLGKNNGKVRENLKKVEMSSHTLLEIINDILGISRIEAGKETIAEDAGDVTYSFASIEPMMQQLASQADIDLQFSFGKIEDRYVICDIAHSNRVFINLISNAIKYSRKGGWVKVHCEQTGREDDKAIYSYTFEDNGIGMSAEFQKQVFQPFSRETTSTVNKIQGTGLGLVMCKNLVELMGGRIFFESEQGKGTKFTVILPFRIQEGHEFTDPQTIAEKENVDFTGKKILLVEDNELNREIACAILEEYGLVITTAENGDIAVQTIRDAKAGDFDLILMDIQMPTIDGYEAARQIRALGTKISRIPILAMTANAFDEDRQAALDAGMNDHLAKPLDLDKIKETLAKFL